MLAQSDKYDFIDVVKSWSTSDTLFIVKMKGFVAVNMIFLVEKIGLTLKSLYFIDIYTYSAIFIASVVIITK